MRGAAIVAVSLAVVAGCKDDPVAVLPGTGSVDHGRSQVIEEVEVLTRAGHSPAAYATFRDRLLALRPGMDETVADEAELFAVTQAVEVVGKLDGAARGAEPLVLTVWPLALAPAITAPVPGARDVDVWSRWMPAQGEDRRAYLIRLCGSLLALECKTVVPDGQATVVGALAIEQLTERTRRAIAMCLTCGDASWKARIGAWEALDREATEAKALAEKQYAPGRWPIAGEAGATPTAGPRLDVEENGAMRLDGAPFSPGDEPTAIDRLRGARGEGQTLRVHLPPRLPSERVRRAQGVAAAAGYAAIALIAREAAYPYAEREYVLPVGAKLPVRDGDPVQVLLRVLDTRSRRATEGGVSAPASAGSAAPRR